jgi:DNA replication and repair protein RecF
MRLLSLEVANYRNIAAAQLEPGRELTVICGNNGQGKTNLLEAIWLLTGGKSFRGGKDAELVRRGETFAVLEAVTQRTRQEDQEPDEPANVRITVGTPDAQRPGRYASVNGSPPKRAAGLAGSFPAVVFDPGHLSLVKGAPEGRRRFLDAALCQLYPGYLATYRRYVRALQQKNALLRHSAGGTERPWAEKCALLEVLNVELAAQGEAIQKRRREYLALLTPLACANYAELSHGAERMAVRYAAQFEPGGLAALLKQRQNEELRAGQSLCGIHREDLELLLDDQPARVYASQGQQRSVVLSLKMAEAAAAAQITGEHPVLLLDDVLSELDEGRKQYLLTCMKEKQTFVTSCDDTDFLKTDGEVYRMDGGVLCKV